MHVTGIRAIPLYAELGAPMRSRGNVGYSEYFHTGSEYQSVTAVELLTDTPHRGVTLLGGDARPWLDGVATPALIGQNPAAIRQCRHRLLQALRAAPEGHQRQGRGFINRLEFALWDLFAKGVDRPLFRLLGGTDPWVDVYAGGGSLCWNPLPLLLREAEALLEAGFRALKLKIGHGPEEDAEMVRKLRARCGPGVRLMVDANRAYDLPGAIRLARTLEEQDVYWFEEPLTYDNPADWRALRESTTVAISGGEGFSRLSQAADALRQGIVRILQCDAGGFGLEGLLAIASMAAEEDVSLTPHSCNSIIGFVVASHLQRALPNSELQEFETFDNPFVQQIFAEQPFIVTRGKVMLSERPGLGVSLNEETVSRYQVAD